MPASTEGQRRAACAAYSCKIGKSPPSKLGGAAKSMYESMTAKQLADFCKHPVKKE